MDFMSPHASIGVDFELVPVREGEYPHHEGQVWASPDIAQAADHMIRLLDHPRVGRVIGEAAREHMRSNFSFRTIGRRCAERVDAIRLQLQ
jgi:glycosyltransferase involved in cell wall biosynthesis